MNEIYQGDNGTSLVLTITDDEKVVDLTGSTVEVVIKFKATGIKKEATIIDAANGKCEVVLSSEDVTKDGIYSLQATVIFEDDRTFSSNVQRFIVNKKIGYVPEIGGSTGNIGDSAINGNIIVNGIEIKVYDDAIIRADINNLKQSQHTHANKSDLDRLGVNAQNHLTIDGIEQVTGGGSGGSSVSDSVTNGNILVNGSEVKVYDDTQIKIDISNKADASQLHSHTNKTVLDQIEQPYTTAEKNKLANIEAGAEINTVTSVNGQIGDVVIDNTELTTEITNIKNSDAIKRFGVSANGRLTIDGVEQTLEDPTSPIDGGTFTTTYNTTIVDGGEF